jgi:hypothetical protein
MKKEKNFGTKISNPRLMNSFLKKKDAAFFIQCEI